MSSVSLETWRSAIVDVFPDLADSTFNALTAGWDCVAVDVDDRLIFKFPRHPQAEEALCREARMLEEIRAAVSLPVPAMSIHHGPPLFSVHQKIPGQHLLPSEYETLTSEDRQHLGNSLGQFYAELHSLDLEVMEQAGAQKIAEWLPAEVIVQKIQPVLAPELFPRAEQTIRSWQSLSPDPHGHIFGFFDGHGWNLAFDHPTRRLRGVYDFADSGFGPLHQDFVYSQWISPDLTSRIMTRYEQITPRPIDRRRVHLLGGILRLSELADYVDDPIYLPVMLRTAEDWLTDSLIGE